MARRIAVSLLFLIIAFQALGPVGRAGATSLSIRVSGNHFIDASGQTVIPHGVNRSGTEYMCIVGWGIFDGPSDAASVQAIKSWTNVNMVRVPLNEDCWLDVNTAGLDPAYLGQNYRNAIANYVDLLNQSGIYTILELHWSAPGTERATGQRPMPDQDHSPAFWSSVASMFKNDPGVIFDLYNEPFPDGNQDTAAAWSCLKNGGTCSGVPFAAAGMQTLVDAVRATGASNVIMVGGVGYAQIMSQWLSYRPADPLGQLAASHHRYGDGWCATPACWNAELLPIAQQVPLVTGEVGEDAQLARCTHIFVDQYMSWADSNSVPYLAWVWDVWGSCLDLITSYDGTPSAYGQAFKDHLASLPPPILFRDDFNDGDATGWSLSPPDYWSVTAGELTAAGSTVGGWSWERASTSLPAGVASFEARMVAPATALSIQGIVASTADELYQILFVVDNGDTLRWSTIISGAWSGWTVVGTTDRTAFHTYAIRRNGDATFTLLLDGAVRAAGISAGPPSAWGSGIGRGILYTQAEQPGQVLGTRFDDVIARP